MTPFLAEILGTFVLLLLGCGVVANVVLKETKGNDSGWIVITAGWAFAVYVGVVIAGPVSGAHLNPAVTIGLASAGDFSWSEVPIYICGQMIGAMLGAFFVWLVYRDHFNSTGDAASKLGVFATIPAIRNTTSNVISEIVGTFVLVYSILHITGASLQGVEEVAIGLGSLGAIPVAIIVFAIGLSLGGTTGYAINPARDLGPRIMHAILPIRGKGKSDWAYSWVPIVGPILGGLAAAGLHVILGA